MVEYGTLKVLWALLRPQTYLLMCIYVILGIAFGLAEQNYRLSEFLAQNTVALLGVLAGLALWYIAATALNDYADYEIDKINLKNDAQRPLVQGAVSREQLLRYAQFASVASLSIVTLTNRWPIIILFLCLLILNATYSLRPIQFSRRGGIAPLLLPLGYIVLTVSSGLLLTGLSLATGSYVLIAAMYLHFMSRIVLKDHRDVRGDAKAGKKTLILRYGNAAVVRLAMVLFAVSTLMFLFLFWQSLHRAMPFLLLLASGAMTALWQLANESTWPKQRPLITIFGRLCSGVITVLIIGLLPSFIRLAEYQQTVLLILTTALFIGSLFEIIRLQQPTHPV